MLTHGLLLDLAHQELPLAINYCNNEKLKKYSVLCARRWEICAWTLWNSWL